MRELSSPQTFSLRPFLGSVKPFEGHRVLVLVCVLILVFQWWLVGADMLNCPPFYNGGGWDKMARSGVLG